MKFSVISLFPEMIKEALREGVVGQAIQSEKIKLEVYNPRDWTHDIHKTIDDRPFGGGDGMVMMAEPLAQALEFILKKSQAVSGENESPVSVKPRVLYLSPQGKTLNHQLVMDLSREAEIILLCGRYAGVDQRLLNHFQFEEVSIGDYVISGGELGALVVIDAVSRQVDGVLGHERSSADDSFAQYGLLEAPLFTRPREWREQEVPSLLLTGNHSQILEDRWALSMLVTFLKREDLLDSYLQKKNEFHKKVLKKVISKLKQIPKKELTALGFSLKNLEDFEFKLQKYGN